VDLKKFATKYVQTWSK